MVNVLVNLFADSIFLQSIQSVYFKFHAWFLQGLCFHMMPCSFQLVPNFLVKKAFFGDRYFIILFFSVHISEFLFFYFFLFFFIFRAFFFKYLKNKQLNR